MERVITYALISCLLAVVALQIEAHEADDRAGGSDREIALLGGASVSDLYRLLSKWGEFHVATTRYVNDSSLASLKGCDIARLTMEDIQGISTFSREQLEKYHARLAQEVKSDVRSVVTSHPCFIEVGDRNITWFYVIQDGKFKVLDHVTVL